MLGLTGFLLALAALGGCGRSSPASSGPPVERGIFISSDDCAQFGKLSIEECGQLIDHAVALHQRLAPAYASLDACTAAEGKDRCANGIDSKYHPTVAAFLITFGDKPSAQPLYGVSDASPGFKGLDKTKYALGDKDYSVSDSAEAIARENAQGTKG
ncbi:DUF1190 domain-containing protein [Hyphomicrobium sp.]|uniref:DUF1190 domain-containing protein n=1 Tax=Hyphomicrobium sp. TaxID=82 RepID=UPI0025B91F4F|nr:DUF1190 domain-containing protein [Hyphomicrobium sp.]